MEVGIGVVGLMIFVGVRGTPPPPSASTKLAVLSPTDDPVTMVVVKHVPFCSALLVRFRALEPLVRSNGI